MSNNRLPPFLLLSIHGKHADRIFEGQKRYELRKQVPRENFARVYLYQTEGVGIVGWFEPGQVLRNHPEQLWRDVGTEATSRDRFFSYFGEARQGCAIEVRTAERFINPVSLKDLRRILGRFTPPLGGLAVHPDSKLYVFLKSVTTGAHDRGASASNPPTSLRAIADSERELFSDLVTREISVNYDDIDGTFAESLLSSHHAGRDRNGFFTMRKEVLSVIGKRKQCLGFTVLTFKRGGSVKTGPTILKPKYRNVGIGKAVRALIERYVTEKGLWRKMYCTCADSAGPVLRYLLNSGLQVEAHLGQHYAQQHGELVLGKVLKRIPSSVQDFSRSPIAGSLARPSEFDHEKLTSAIQNMFAHFWCLLSRQMIGKAIKDSSVAMQGSLEIVYQEKPRTMVLVQHDGACIAATFLVPKRGGALKCMMATNSSHGDTLLMLIRQVESVARAMGRHKIFYLHPIADCQVLSHLYSEGYAIEGVLREPYRAGQDVVVLSKFFDRIRRTDRVVT